MSRRSCFPSLLTSFFFYSSAAPRHLHSFPTRRSSDLPAGLGAEGVGGIVEHGLRLEAVRERGRSEEHTSELQSRGHLVCRLLLEKKKSRQRHTGPPHGRNSTAQAARAHAARRAVRRNS